MSLHTLLYGHWLEENLSRRYALLGLCYAESSEDHKKQRLFPLFWAGKDASGGRHFTSLPYGRVRNAAGDEKQDWLVPFYIRNQSPQASSLHTLLYGHWLDENLSRRYALLGLCYAESSKDHKKQRLFPVYWYNKMPAGESLVSPLFMRGVNNETEQRWHVVVPLYYRSTSPKTNALYTPLGGGSRGADGSGHIISPLYVQYKDASGLRVDMMPAILSWRSVQAERTNWHALGPLSRLSVGEQAQSSYVAPVFYWNPDSGTLLSPLHQRGGTDESRRRWHASVPLYLRMESDAASAWITPLGALTRYADGGKHTITPLYVNLEDGDQSAFRAVPPLLSWQLQKQNRSDYWLAMGLARFGTGKEAGASHVLPVFYRNASGNTLLTPLWSAWQDEDTLVHAIPPLLSWRRTQEDGARSTRVLGGLGARDTDSDGAHVRSHLIPFYTANSSKNRLISPAYARWQDDAGGRYDLIPPLLSWRKIDARTNRSVRVAGGLYGQTRADEGTMRNSHLFPIYAYHKNQHFYTPLVGRDHPETGRFRYWLTPLVGTYRNRLSGSWLWPLYHFRKNAQTGHHSSSFLLWGYHRTGEHHSRTGFFPVFNRRHIERDVVDIEPEKPRYEHMRRTLHENTLSLLMLYRQHERVTQYGTRSAPEIEGERYTQRALHTNRLFPLWRFEREEYGKDDAGPMRRTGNVLWRLYDHETEHGAADKPHEYVRRRILWHAWHYERLNGQVSVDSLPFITYDSRPDGFRKFTFLWRGFRYENDPEDGRKIDFLFMPILR